MTRDCNLEVNEFELQSRYNIYLQTIPFEKGMNLQVWVK